MAQQMVSIEEYPEAVLSYDDRAGRLITPVPSFQNYLDARFIWEHLRQGDFEDVDRTNAVPGLIGVLFKIPGQSNEFEWGVNPHRQKVYYLWERISDG